MGQGRGAATPRTGRTSKPVRPAVAATSEGDRRAANPIDRFVLARLEKEGLTPSPEADRYTLIRRVAPRPDRPAADAGGGRRVRQGHVAGRLREAGRPAAGEARVTASTGRGCGSTSPATPTPTATPTTRRAPSGRTATGSSTRSTRTCRSTGSRSSRSPATCCRTRPTEQLIATAFHRNTMTNNEGGTNDEEFRNVAVVDRVNTTGTVWMGTTIGLRPVPHPQVRPDHAEGVLPGLRLLQQHRGRRPARREPDAAVLDAGAARRRSSCEARSRCDLEDELKGKKPAELEGRARPARRRSRRSWRRSSRSTTRADHEGADRRASGARRASSSAATSSTWATR